MSHRVVESRRHAAAPSPSCPFSESALMKVGWTAAAVYRFACILSLSLIGTPGPISFPLLQACVHHQHLCLSTLACPCRLYFATAPPSICQRHRITSAASDFSSFLFLQPRSLVAAHCPAGPMLFACLPLRSHLCLALLIY